ALRARARAQEWEGPAADRGPGHGAGGEAAVVDEEADELAQDRGESAHGFIPPPRAPRSGVRARAAPRPMPRAGTRRRDRGAPSRRPANRRRSLAPARRYRRPRAARPPRT